VANPSFTGWDTPEFGPRSSGDILRIPSANYWVAVFVFVTQLPGVGQKKVILADRRGRVEADSELLVFPPLGWLERDVGPLRDDGPEPVAFVDGLARKHFDA
jgi:hypothetical protein